MEAPGEHSCHVYRQGSCVFDGRLEELEELPSWQLCHQFCQVNSCEHWTYDQLERLCGTYSTGARLCLASYSPSLESPGYCGEEVATTTTLSPSYPLTLVTGGQLPNSSYVRAVQVVGGSCEVPPLHTGRAGHFTVAAPGGEVLTCGGTFVPSDYEDGRLCYYLDLGLGLWRIHSRMATWHQHPLVVPLAGATVVLDPVYQACEVLPADLPVWTGGLATCPPRYTRGSVAVPTGEDTFLLVGGSESATLVEEYQYGPSFGFLHRRLADLPLPCDHCGAARLGNLVVIAGGINPFNIDATQILDLATETLRLGLPMVEARVGLAMAVRGGRLYALGGRDGEEALDTIEEWDPLLATWQVTGDRLALATTGFAVTTVPSNSVCL